MRQVSTRVRTADTHIKRTSHDTTDACVHELHVSLQLQPICIVDQGFYYMHLRDVQVNQDGWSISYLLSLIASSCLIPTTFPCMMKCMLKCSAAQECFSVVGRRSTTACQWRPSRTTRNSHSSRHLDYPHCWICRLEWGLLHSYLQKKYIHHEKAIIVGRTPLHR